VAEDSVQFIYKNGAYTLTQQTKPESGDINSNCDDTPLLL